jgi:hypothetical protein
VKGVRQDFKDGIFVFILCDLPDEQRCEKYSSKCETRTNTDLGERFNLDLLERFIFYVKLCPMVAIPILRLIAEDVYLKTKSSDDLIRPQNSSLLILRLSMIEFI